MSDRPLGFHVSVHARPAGDWPVRSQWLDGHLTGILEIPSASLRDPMPRSFEDAFASLERLPRFFIEPDGAFVWVGNRDGPSIWQLDGMLYDRQGRLFYLELKGDCPPAAWGELLAACGGEPSQFVVQVIRHALVMEATEFARRLTGS